MGNNNEPNSKPTSILVPNNYPMIPTSGKIGLLFDANSNELYHKYNLNNYDNGSFFGSSQPYIYKEIGDKSFGGRGLPLEFGIQDIVRVTKFIGSGRGLIFLGKQFLLQGFQPFDETNIYNPSSTVLSTVANMSMGILDKPKRHIDKSGGLLGGLASLIGVSISRADPPPSTVAAGDGSGGSSEGKLFGGFSLFGNSSGNRESEVLSVQNYGNATGLLRAKTANKARSILQQKLRATTGDISGGFMGFLKGIAKSIIPQIFGSDKQNYKQRADDVAYQWMVKYYNDYTAKGQASGNQNKGLSVGFMGIGLKTQSPIKQSVKINDSNIDLFKQKYYSDVDKKTKVYTIDGSYYKNENDSKSEQKQKFEDSGYDFGIQQIEDQKDTYFDTKNWKTVDGKSPIETAFGEYKKDGSVVTSKELTDKGFFVSEYDLKNNPFWDTGFRNDKSSTVNLRSPSQNTKLNKVDDSDTPTSQFNESLKRVINNIGHSQIYTTTFSNNDTWLFSSGKSSKQGYDRLYHTMKKVHPSSNSRTGNPLNEGTNTVQSHYYNVRTLDSIINPNKNFGMAGNGRPDKINTLTVLSKGNNGITETSDYKGNNGGWVEWKPYDDDLIAFFFYDVVNEKYIPFRSTIKGLSESNNALWDPLKFMGRADEIYSYTGFTRNLSFSFIVVVNSLIELHPVWNKINYLMGAVKPAGYTKLVHGDKTTNRFIIPPMFMLTIGDLYKYQPIVINTATMNIPESAIWETVSESSIDEWSYLADIIKSPKVKNKHVGQVPREIEISITCNVLEKERPHVGGNHFGHSPLLDNEGMGWNEQPKIDFLPPIQEFSKNIREQNTTYPSLPGFVGRAKSRI